MAVTPQDLLEAGLRLCGCREVMPLYLYNPDGRRADVDIGECRLCLGTFNRKRMP
jgi:hypothetical protein